MINLLKSQSVVLLAILLIVPGCVNRDKKRAGNIPVKDSVVVSVVPETIRIDKPPIMPGDLGIDDTTEIDEHTDNIFFAVEEMPEFPGGNTALMKFIADNIKYPAEAQEQAIQGRVICNFVVMKDGTIQDVQVIRGVNPLLDKEAIRVLNSMPEWKPGILGGVAVNVRFTLPVSFRLKEEDVKRDITKDIIPE